MNTSITRDSSRSFSEDRGEIIYLSRGLCLAVGDGAGGMSGGAEAADKFLNAVKQSTASLSTEDSCAALLRSIDSSIDADPSAGETTGVIVIVQFDRIFGASVGDSAAWLFGEQSRHELTRAQTRKPFLGSGGARPQPFVLESQFGTLVVATDGLWKYTSIEAIHKVVKENGSSGLAHKLIELVRLKSGTLPDDICVITCTVP